MKKFLLAALIATLGIGFVATDVEAKRLGGGMSQGMKRAPVAPAMPAPTTPTQPSRPTAPAANPTPNQAAAAAAAPRRSWMGPIAGLAAGLGIAALMSHFGMGAAMGNFIMMALIALVAVVVIRMLINAFRKPSAAGQGMAFAGANPAYVPPAQASGSFSGPGTGATATASLADPAVAPVDVQPAVTGPIPAGFDAEGLERVAKVMFVRLQVANDAGNLDDLRQFSTPEMFASFRTDLLDRPAAQQTDVMRLDARLLELAEENGQQIASVRYQGLIREQAGLAQPFDETWHLVRPVGSAPDAPWAIAGILQAV